MELIAEPLVSVIIPTFNRAHLIGHTLGNVYEQSYKNMEVIVVDDASTDNTRDIAQKFSDPRIKYIRLDKNRGPSAARNAGVRSARGQFVAFMDSDDEWHKQKIQLQLAAIKQQTSPGNVVCFTRVIVRGNNSTYLLPSRGKYEDEPIGDYVCGNDGLILTSSIMLARDIALENPFPVDQKHFEDWDLLLRLEEKGVHWLYLDQTLTTWNNEHREDRLSLLPDDSSLWLDEHKKYLSKKARNAFSIKAIVRPLILLRQRKLYALKITFYCFLASEVSFSKFIKLTLKILIPPALLQQLKTLVPFYSRRKMDT